jgi:biopolymer transport protein ExbD
MSHGNTDKCEPNFIPLLDLVLQLVMFFMLCANFVLEQTNVEIKLPKAIAAKALTEKDQFAIYLNVNQEGKVLLPPTEHYEDSTKKVTSVLENPINVEIYLKRKAKEDIDAAGPPTKDKPLRSVIILRVHQDCPFEKTYAIMRACRVAGYLRVQLRAELSSEG